MQLFLGNLLPIQDGKPLSYHRSGFLGFLWLQRATFSQLSIIKYDNILLMLEDIRGKDMSPCMEVVGPGDNSFNLRSTVPYLKRSSFGRVPDPIFLIHGVL